MARFLIFPYSNQMGTTVPTISLAHMLIEAGHEVIFASDGKYTNVIIEKNYPVIPINEISYDQYREHIDQNNNDFYSTSLIRHFVDQELKLIEEVNPDIVVHHNRQTVYISAQIAKKKLITLTVATLSNFFNFKYFVPENHPYNVFYPFGDVNNIFPPKLTRNIMSNTMREWAINFNEVMNWNKLSPVHNYFDLSTGDITLLVETFGIAPVIEPLPENVFFLEQDLDSTYGDVPDWLPELIRLKEEGIKVIYVTMGSSAKTTYPKVIETLSELIFNNPDKYALVSNHVGIITEYKKHKNIFIEKYINAKQILPHTDLVITHGGKNTINECLVAKKPVLGIPEQAEQLWNLKYFEEIGVGKVIYKSELMNKTHKLIENIEMMIKDKELTNRIDSFVNEVIVKRDLVDHKKTLMKSITALSDARN